MGEETERERCFGAHPCPCTCAVSLLSFRSIQGILKAHLHGMLVPASTTIIMCIFMVIFACLPYCCLCGPTHVVQCGSADLKLLTCDCRYQQQRQQQLQSGRQMPPLPAFLRNLTAQQPTASSSYPAQHAANSVLSGSPAQYLQSRQPQAAANTAPHPVMSGEHGVQCNMDLHMSIPLFYKTVM